MLNQLPEPAPVYSPLQKQMWCCKRCGNLRQWGTGRPASRKAEPFLLCDDCGGHVPHLFHGIR